MERRRPADPPTQASRTGSKRQPARDRIVETGALAAPRETAWSRRAFRARSSPMARSAPSCALARVPGRRADGVDALPGRVRAAQDGSRMHCASMPRRSRSCHRQGAGCYGHNSRRRRGVRRRVRRHANAGPHACACNGRARTSSRPRRWARPWWSGCARCSMPMRRPADWTIEIWSPVHAQRPGMNGSANLLGAEALPDAPPPPAEINDVAGRRRRRRARATRRRSTTCRGTGWSTTCCLASPVRTSSLRGLGAFANVFAIESLHGRAGRDARRGSGGLPALAHVRSACAAA